MKVVKNEEVVRNLNKLIRSGLLTTDEQEIASRLRDRTIILQGTDLAVTGLPYHASVEFVQNRVDILASLRWDF